MKAEKPKHRQARESREKQSGVVNAKVYEWFKTQSSGGREVYKRVKVNKKHNEDVYDFTNLTSGCSMHLQTSGTSVKNLLLEIRRMDTILMTILTITIRRILFPSQHPFLNWLLPLWILSNMKIILLLLCILEIL